jgi:type II secretory pathway pseudopilin PulG
VLEVLIAVVILGLVAWLTIPRLSPAAQAPDAGIVLRQRIRVLRVAIERYYQDHGAYPGKRSDGRNPAASEAAAVAQLTGCTDMDGQVADQADELHRFGPYLSAGVPPCPAEPRAGMTGMHVVSGATPVTFLPEAVQAGWVYNCDTGMVAANSNGADASGRPLASY